MDLTTDEEIVSFTEKIKDLLISKQISHIVVDIGQLNNFFLLVKEGFLPYFDDNDDQSLVFGLQDVSKRTLIYKYITAVLIDKYTQGELDFWFNHGGFKKFLASFSTGSRWIYATIEYHRNNIDELKWGDYLPLLLYARNMTYQSGRSKTDMAMFRTPASKTRFTEGKKSIPVTRYASNVNSSLFFTTNNDDNFCGTFYFMEPESTTFLEYETSLTFPNKYKAILHLTEKQASGNAKRLIKNFENEPDTGFYTGLNDSYIPPDMMMSPAEIQWSYDFLFDEWNEEEVAILPQKKRYVGFFLNLYGLDSSFDQELCKLASSFGIDLLIFDGLPGPHQVITEVLDTRNRKNSFDNLVYRG